MTAPPTERRQKSQVQVLQAALQRWESSRHCGGGERISSGIAALDEMLPRGGWHRGSLVQWLAGRGSSAVVLALHAARHACLPDRTLVVIDRDGDFYPPAAARLGVDLGAMVVVRPLSTADLLWAADQALRCPAIGAVLGWASALDGRTLRRLQLAAEEGGTLGLLLCQSDRRRASGAEVRLRVRARPGGVQRQVEVELLYCRGGRGGAVRILEIDDETGAVRLASALAAATALPRSTGTS